MDPGIDEQRGAPRVKPCALCDRREVRLVYRQTRFPVVACRRCGLIYADERFQATDLQAFYSGRYYERAYVGHPPRIDEKIAGDYERVFREVGLAASGGRLLDFGCARGRFLQRLRDSGAAPQWRLEGLDMNPDEVGIGRALGLEIRAGTLADAGFEDRHFDAITAFSVLEHVQDPVAVLRELARILRPGGRLLALVPSGRCLLIALATLWSRLAPGRLRGLTDLVFHEEHLYYFTRETIPAVLERGGFAAERIFHRPSYLELHPPGPLSAAGVTLVRAASFLSNRPTMLGFLARRTS